MDQKLARYKFEVTAVKPVHGDIVMTTSLSVKIVFIKKPHGAVLTRMMKNYLVKILYDFGKGLTTM